MNRKVVERAIQIRYGDVPVQELLFNFYFGGSIELFKAQPSPFRETSGTSVSIIRTTDGTLLAHDFARGTTVNCWRLPCESRQEPFSWNATFFYLDQDLNLGLFEENFLTVPREVNFSKIDSKSRVSPEIGINTRDYTLVDYKYWVEKSKLSLETLRHFSIFSTYSALFRFGLGEWSVYHIWQMHDPLYAYHLIDQYGKPKYKLLRPYAIKKLKWRGNANDYDKFLVQGYRQLPENGEVAFITSSLKDVATLYEVGYPAVAPHGEGYTLPEGLVAELKLRYRRVYLLYDNDTSGHLNAARILEAHPEIDGAIFVPVGKDPTGFVEQESKQVLFNFLQKCLI